MQSHPLQTVVKPSTTVKSKKTCLWDNSVIIGGASVKVLFLSHSLIQ